MKLWLRNLIFAGGCIAVAGLVAGRLLQRAPMPGPQSHDAAAFASVEFQAAVQVVNRAFADAWQQAGVRPTPRADDLMLARRLSLALTGTIPSLEEVRALETVEELDRIQWWLSRLFEDRRYGDYLAERIARMTVGVEGGPFIVYRRHRLVSWLSDELMANRSYDELVRQLIAAEGIWTTRPEANFVTVTIDPNNDKEGPDEMKLAGRVSKAFLGVRLDCVQCHDDFLDDKWEQRDFHRLAAFFAGAEMGLTGLRDNESREYEYRFLGKREAEPVPQSVPFFEELLPAEGGTRQRVAAWVTHPDNRAFARTLVNRTWALLFNRPLHSPIDDIPLEGPFPAGMEELADDLIAHRFDLRRLIRVIAATEAFQRDSRSADGAEPVTDEQERLFAAFPLTRLRPEQMAGSVLQSSNLRTIDAESHVLVRIIRFFQQNDFIKRYGDVGEDEFDELGGTIPQRLILMNGKLVHERTSDNIVLNAATRIGAVAPDHATAVETAYLATLTRRPSTDESEYFVNRLKTNVEQKKSDLMEDLFWTLLNSTEFSWNH